MKLSPHARERLGERKDDDMKYNTQNIMRSSVKWYGKDDLIHDCPLYRHCCYVTRKSQQIGFITDGDIEVIYNKGTHVAITVLEVKEKFKPITQFIKPQKLLQIERKKKNNKLKDTLNLGYISRINNEVIIDNYEKSTDYIEGATMTFYEVYASLVTEMLNYTSNLGYHSTETTLKNEQSYNIVYKEKTTKPMTISELFGVDKKVYKETISAVKNNMR